MNTLEKQRLEIGEYLVKECDAKAYKASFEDEGASFEDISRAKIITAKVGLNLDIKVGGCEAIANIREAKILGARAIIGPMIETPYAMRKFIGAVKKVYDKEELDDIDLGVNIETITGANNFEEILDVINEEKIIKRIAVGRSDFIGSMGLPKSDINNKEIFNHVYKIFTLAKKYNLVTAMGGGIDIDAIPFIKSLGKLLDYYETRYIIFQNDPEKLDKDMAIGILNAQKFEANYLEDMSNRYRNWSTSNLDRCQMIKKRIKKADNYINK